MNITITFSHYILVSFTTYLSSHTTIRTDQMDAILKRINHKCRTKEWSTNYRNSQKYLLNQSYAKSVQITEADYTENQSNTTRSKHANKTYTNRWQSNIIELYTPHTYDRYATEVSQLTIYFNQN